MVHEKDEDAGIFAEAQDGYHVVEREHDFSLKVWSSGRLERLVVAKMHENIRREAAEAEIHVARFSRHILRRKSVRKYLHLLALFRTCNINLRKKDRPAPVSHPAS